MASTTTAATTATTTTAATTATNNNNNNNKLMRTLLLPSPYTYDHLYSSYAVEWEHAAAATKSNNDNAGDGHVQDEEREGQEVEVSSLAWVCNFGGGSLTYLVGCTTAGEVVIWDMTTRNEEEEEVGGDDDLPPHQSTTTVPTAVPNHHRHKPIIRQKVSNGPLHKVQVVSVVNPPRDLRVGRADDDFSAATTIITGTNHDHSLDEVDTTAADRDIINDDDDDDNTTTTKGVGRHNGKTFTYVVVAGEGGLWSLGLASLLVRHEGGDSSSSSSSSSSFFSSSGCTVQLINQADLASSSSSSSIVDFDIVEHQVVDNKDGRDGTTAVSNLVLYVVMDEVKLERRRRRRRPSSSLQFLGHHQVTRWVTISQWDFTNVSSGSGIGEKARQPDACFTLQPHVLDSQLQEHVTAFKVVKDSSFAEEKESGPLMVLLLGTSHSRILVVPVEQFGLVGGIQLPAAVVSPSTILELPPLSPRAGTTITTTAPPTNKRPPKKPKRNHQQPTQQQQQQQQQQELNKSRLAVTSIDTTNGTWWTVGAAAPTQLGLSSTTATTSTDPRPGGMVATWHAATRSLVSSCRTRESIQGLLVDVRRTSGGGSSGGMYTIANEKVITVWKSPFDFQDGQQLRRRTWSSAPSNNALALERSVQSSSLPLYKNRLAVGGVGNKVDILVDACWTQSLSVV